MVRIKSAALRLAAFLLLAAGLPACSYYSRVIVQKDPLTGGERAQLAAAYEAQNLQALAEREYRRALSKDRRNFQALIALGNLSMEAGKWSRAEKYFKQALKVEKESAAARNNLAVAYLKQGKHLDRAQELLASALEKPGALKPYLLDTQANLFIAQGRTLEAHQTLTEAAQSQEIAKNPDFRAQFLASCDKLAGLYVSQRETLHSVR